MHELREHERVLVESGGKYACKSILRTAEVGGYIGGYIKETGSAAFEAGKNPGQSLAMLKAPLFCDGA